MRATLKHVLMVTTGTVVAAAALLPLVRGYGTALYQAVVLGSWGLVARLASPQFADRHDLVVWTVAALINGLLFLLPAVLIWILTRKRRARLGMGLLVAWSLFYLASLFFLFPAADGP